MIFGRATVSSGYWAVLFDIGLHPEWQGEISSHYLIGIKLSDFTGSYYTGYLAKQTIAIEIEG